MPTIEIIGKPLGQPRQRHAMIGGQVRNYTPGAHPVHGFKLDIKQQWAYGPNWKIEGPVRCIITAIFDRPKSKTKKRGDNPRLDHTGKPDCDNIAKAVCDALNGVAWKDDSQVAELTVRKFVGTPDESARVIVEIEPIEAGGERR